MNFVLNGSGGFIEVQGTAEQKPFSSDELANMITAATAAASVLKEQQLASLN